MTHVTVFGGTGFLGRSIVGRLAREGATLRMAVRHTGRAAIANSVGLGRAIPVAADIRDPPTIAPAIAGSQSVINAVSAYVERGGVTYDAVHVQGAGNVATACRQQQVARLVHISGIGANPESRSPYIRSRGLGELTVKKAFSSATIMRPSVMFAIDAGFLKALKKMARSTQIIPLIGTGSTRLQPVFVNDVAEAVSRALRNPGSFGKTYEPGGPEIYTLREIFDMVLAHMGLSRHFVSVPFTIASGLARVLELLPGAPLTIAQVDLLRGDNVVGDGAVGFEELGMIPQKLRDTVTHVA
jgi:NADH dehydrogenase